MVRREATPGEVTPFAASRASEFRMSLCWTRSRRCRQERGLFRCLAVYVEDKIVLILRDKDKAGETDNGVWLATTEDHHRSLRRDFPTMHPLRFWEECAGKKATGWQVLPPTLRILRKRPCVLRFVLAEDPRIGKVPGARDRRRRRKPRKAADRRRILDCHPGRFLDCHPDLSGAEGEGLQLIPPETTNGRCAKYRREIRPASCPRCHVQVFILAKKSVALAQVLRGGSKMLQFCRGLP